MRSPAQLRTPDAAGWELQRMGRRLPRALRQARNLSTAQRILAVAEKIFAEQGLAGARMEEIARAAKVNKALLYYYFRSKEELHRFVLEALLSQLGGGLERSRAATLSPRQRLMAAIDHFFAFVQEHPNYPRLVQREMMSRGPNLEWIISKYYRPLHGRLLRTIEEGIAAGEIPALEAPHAPPPDASPLVLFFMPAPGFERLHPR